MTADEKRYLIAALRADGDPHIRRATETVVRAGDVLLAEIERLKGEIARERAQLTALGLDPERRHA
jgi:hypothetical protein